MRELRVSLRFGPSDTRAVGTLVERGARVWFEYDPGFRQKGLEISPLRLPTSLTGLHAHPVKPGVPLPGVFNDARPDGWGLKLLHRAFARRGRAASSVSALDELAFLGSRTMGALTFEPATGPAGDLADAIELSALAQHAQRVWDDRVEVVLPELVRVAGPSGGARPKALIGLRSDGGPGVCFGEGDLPKGWDAWLVKFPTALDDRDVGRRELAWNRMAAAAGIDVPASGVLALDGVGDAFVVRRFDRPGARRRLHMLSAAGALDVDYSAAMADYEHLLKMASVLSNGDQRSVMALFRRAVFNVAAVNEDDHLKNLAWLMDADGRWRLSPAYDVTYAPRPRGERWTTVVGIGREIDRGALMALGARLGIRKRAVQQVLEEVCQVTADVASFLKSHDCSHPVSQEAARAVTTATARVLSG